MGFADELYDDLRGRCLSAFQQVASEFAADVVELISLPVGRSRGPRGGTITIRSLPGEPPRRDTGRYVASVRHDAGFEGGRIYAAAYTVSLVGLYLEKGTDRMAERPHWDTVYRAWLPKVAGRVGDLMFGGSVAA